MADGFGRGTITTDFPRCWRCNRLLAEKVSEPWAIKCSRCKAANKGGTP